MTPRQWAEIAASGVAAFEEQHEWLCRHCTDEAVALLVGLLVSEEADVWTYALRSIPEARQLPADLVSAAVARVRTGESYSVREVARRLALAAGDQPLRELASSSQQFAEILRPLLAQIGDETSLGLLLDELRDSLKRGEAVDGDTLGWLDGVGDHPRWLDRLFACLRFSFVRPATGRGARDTVGPLVAAIEQIAQAHPETVLAKFDELFAADPECRSATRPARSRRVQPARRPRTGSCARCEHRRATPGACFTARRCVTC